MNEKNKFTKTLGQFYLQPILQNSLKKVQQQLFSYNTRKLRSNKVFEFNQRIQERKQKSLINFDSFSKIIEAQEKVFRSSVSFSNPQKACISNQNRRLTSLLKSHILEENHDKIKRYRLFQTGKNKQKSKDFSVSNYNNFDEFLTEKKRINLQSSKMIRLRNRYRQ